eukprot:Sspe_Gene.44982::Locus_22141_Transcript_1_1_Confidence_1.000_Length_2063::g.44982::m.44982
MDGIIAELRRSSSRQNSMTMNEKLTRTSFTAIASEVVRGKRATSAIKKLSNRNTNWMKALNKIRDDSVFGSPMQSPFAQPPPVIVSEGGIDSTALLFYCTVCEQLCSLDDIILDGKHKTHEYIYSTEQAMITKYEIEAHTRAAKEAKPVYEEKIERVRRLMDELNEMTQKLEQTVEARFDQLHQQLEHRKGQLLRDIRLAKEKRVVPLNDLEVRMKTILDRAMGSIEELGTLADEIKIPPYHPISSGYMAFMKARGVDVELERKKQAEAKQNMAGDSPAETPRNSSLQSPTAPPSPRLSIGGEEMSDFQSSWNSDEFSSSPSYSSRKAVLAKRKEREKQREERRKRMTTGSTSKSRKKQYPKLPSDNILNFIRYRKQMLQALQTMESSPFPIPDADKIDVVFNTRLDSELKAFGRVVVTQAGFRPTSKANYGGTLLKPLPKDAIGADPNVMGRGVVWWLGTKGGCEPFRNPSKTGVMQVRCTALFHLGEVRYFTSTQGAPQPCITNNQQGVSATLFLGSRRNLVPTHIQIRHGFKSSQYAMQSFSLEGADMEVAGIDHPGQYTLLLEKDVEITTGFEIHTFQIEPTVHRSFQYFRVRMTSPNNMPESRDQWRMSISGIELFGTLYDNS